MMKKVIIWIIIIVVAVGLVGAVIFQINNKATNSRSIKIGASLGLTGFASTWGEAERNGIKIAIIGPSWLDSYKGAAPFAGQKKVIMLSPSAAITAVQSPLVYKNVFSTWIRSDKQLEQLAEYLKNKGKKNIVLLLQNDSFWDDFSGRFKIKSEKIGLNIQEIRFGENEADFRTYLTKIKNYEVDAIVFGINSEKATLSFLKQKSSIMPSVPFFTSEWIEDFVSKPDYKNFLEGLTYIAPPKADQSFVKKYKKLYKIDPVFSASNAYDAVKILARAIENTDGSTDSVREYLLKTEFDTVSFGKAKFDKIGGIIGGKFVFKSVRDGKLNEYN